MRKITTNHRWFFRRVMGIAKLFKKKPQIFNLNKEPFEKGLIISNHSAASGPLTLSLYFPTFFIPWGTYEMTGRYKVRWNYLYHVFYQQKLGYGKVKSFIIATLFAIISRMLYRGMQLIPTYPDVRFKKTIDYSLAHLEKGNSILVFPEDSDTGYHETLLKYNNGFVYLSEKHYKAHKEDLAIYPVYFHKRKSAMIIGEKQYIQPLREKGLKRDEIAEHFKDITNNLKDQLFDLVGEQ